MMRILSSATNSTKGVYFGSTVLEKLASKLFLTPHPKPFLRASFCANKKFQAYYGKTAVFRFDVESREKKY